MILISHRGNIDHPDPSKENHPDQIKKVLSQGFNCEIDVRYIDGKYLLGHDEPQYEVGLDFLCGLGLWIHCKTIDALYEISKYRIRYFFHDKDDATLTSDNYIWTYPGKKLTPNSICVIPEMIMNPANIRKYLEDNLCAGVCSDYIGII